MYVVRDIVKLVSNPSKLICVLFYNEELLMGVRSASWSEICWGKNSVFEKNKLKKQLCNLMHFHLCAVQAAQVFFCITKCTDEHLSMLI